MNLSKAESVSTSAFSTVGNRVSDIPSADVFPVFDEFEFEMFMYFRC